MTRKRSSSAIGHATDKPLALMDGLAVGLLGGSFNPPHVGHRLISQAALRLLGLDYVLWLVTPGNPLKDAANYASLARRLEAARACAAHPRIMATDLEARHGLRYTADTLSFLRQRHPTTRFVWMMGADNLAGFHHWRDWRGIARSVPIAIFGRPGHRLSPLGAPAAITLARSRLPLSAAATLKDREAPAWIYFPGTNNAESSTRLRQHNPDWTQSN